MTALGLKVKAKDWPHGLRCCDCDRRLIHGDRYSKRFDSVTEGGVPVVEIVCIGCALAPVEHLEGGDE